MSDAPVIGGTPADVPAATRRNGLRAAAGHLRRGMLLACLVLAACAAPREAPEPAGPPRAYAGPPRGFGDADPFDFTDPPGRLPVHGVDASRWDGRVDWAEAARNGVSFAWIKATEGGDLADPRFREHWRAAGAAGIPRGAYHVFYWCRPAVEQAGWFIRHVPRTPGTLPPALDVEWTPFSPTCTDRPPPGVVRAEMRAFLRLIEAHYGTRPIIYTVPDFFDDNDLGSFDGYEFWLRSTAAHPSERYPGTDWTFWQYTGTGITPGFARPGDQNAFRGSVAAFRTWLARRSQR